MLEHIELPSSLVEIGDRAFMDCSKLASIELPEHLQNIGKGAFFNCNSLKYIKVPEEVKKISASTFERCIDLQEVTLPEGLVEIGETAFKASGIREILIPDNVKSIASEAFMDCVDLKSITLSKGLEELYGFVFGGCMQLETLELPSNLRRIEQYAFYDTNFKELIIPKNSDGSEIYMTWLFASSKMMPIWLRHEYDSDYIVLPKNDCPLESLTILGKMSPESSFITCNCQNLKKIYIGEGNTVLPKATAFNKEHVTLFLPSTMQSIRRWNFTAESIDIVCFAINPPEIEWGFDLRDSNVAPSRRIIHVMPGRGEVYKNGFQNNAKHFTIIEDADKYLDEYRSTGIQAIDAIPTVSTAIYDLQGRQLQQKPSKGMYIQGGKKVLVK